MIRHEDNYASSNRKKASYEQFKTKTLAFIIMLNGMTTVTRFISQSLLSRAAYGSYAMYGIVLILIFILLYRFPERRFGVRFVSALFVTASIYAFNYLLFPVTQIYYSEYMNNLFDIFIIGIPCGVLFCDLENPFSLIKALRPYLRLLSVLIPIVYVLGGTKLYGAMEWGNRCYRVALLYFLCYNLDKESNLKSESVLLLLIILFSTLGGRQSFAFLFLGIALIILFKDKKTTKEKIRVYFLSASLAFVSLFYRTILEQITSFLSAKNIRSRALIKLSNESFLDTSNRSSIYQMAKEVISEKQNKITGIYSDIYYLKGHYAHNFLYEFQIDFGLILGSVLCAVIIISIIFAYIKCKKEHRLFFLVIVIISVAKLLVSSSVFIESGPLICLGLIMNKKIRQSKRSKAHAKVMKQPDTL